MGVIRRIKKNMVECILTEQDVIGLGYDFDCISKDMGNAQEFMQEVMGMAEEELEGRPDAEGEFTGTASIDFGGNNNERLVRVRLGWNGTVGYGSEGGMGSVPADNGKETADRSRELIRMKDEECDFSFALRFCSLEPAIRFAQESSARRDLAEAGDVYTGLAKHKDAYYLIIDGHGKGGLVAKLLMVAGEYFADVIADDIQLTYICEHGKAIIEENALEELGKV